MLFRSEGWAERRRPGTAQAAAAREAREAGEAPETPEVGEAGATREVTDPA